MRKTTVYLPERLADELAGLAGAQGRPQAHLIRLAIERLLAAEHPPRAVDPVNRQADPTTRDAGPNPLGVALVGVGVGPGDPRQLTLAALDALDAADRVMAPTGSVESLGRAESIVRQARPRLPVERLEFVMVADGAARDAAIEAACDRVVTCLDAGERVAFVTLGDPNVYSTFASVAEGVRRRRPHVPIESVAGVMAFQALAARSATTLLDGTESLALCTAMSGPDEVAAAAADPDRAVVVYKGGRHLGTLAQRLDGLGRLDGALVGELLGLPGERVAPLAEVADAPATYLATVIVPPVRP